MMTAEKEEKPRYLPENVPSHLFTRNELKLMGIVPIADFKALVLYPEQKREYQLYELHETRSPKKQTGFSVVPNGWTVEQVLAKRRHAIVVRSCQLGTNSDN